jgi:predicted MFS family arabinose efflux permease
VATPAIHVLPFEFPDIEPRQVAVITALMVTFMGLGFAAGPVVTGLVAELTGSIQTGLIVLALITATGVIAGMAYPNRPR